MSTQTVVKEGEVQRKYRPYVPETMEMKEFTFRAIFLGLIMTAILGAANAYLGLRAGMTIAATYPAAVIGMALLRLMKGSLLEENIARTVGSIGESVAAGAVFTIPAFVMAGLWSGLTTDKYWNSVALMVIGGLSVLLRYTAWGRRVRATSDDQAIARLQGIRVRPLFASVTGIAIAAAALAGTLNAVTTGVYPTLGALTLIFAFEAVIIGGLGSLWGTLLGGMLLGVTQVLVSQVSVPYAILASQLLFLVVLAVRPQGMFGNPQVVG